MNIKHPELLFMILFIPLFMGFMYFTWKRRKQALSKLCDINQLKKLFPSSSKRKVLFRYFLICLSFTLFVTAIISPRWGYEWKKIETKGTNIFVALDLSRSMLADDVKPNRLTRAKLDLIKLLTKLQGDTVGLIIFGGEAFLQSPLTHDYLMLSNWIKELQYGAVPVRGTSLKSAIKEAIKHFQHIKSKSKALVIMSDGEEHDEETLEMARRAKQAGIKIYSIGIGTQAGTPIPFAGGLVKDESGNIVLSKLDDTLLKEVAEITGGFYVRSAAGDFHLETIYYEHIRKDLTAETLKSGKSKLWFETYQIFLGLTLFLLLLEFFMSLDWGFAFVQRIFARRRKNFVPLILLGFLVNSAPASADLINTDKIKGDQSLKKEKHDEALNNYLQAQVKDPHDPALNYHMGIAFYRKGDYKKSLTSFNKSLKYSRDPVLTEQALYNLGNSHFKMRKYKDAIDAYEKALKIIPQDQDAKFNLELAKKLLEKSDKDGDGGESDKPDDKKDDKNKNKDQNKNGQGNDKNKDQDDQKKKEQDKKDQQDKERQRQEQEQRRKDMENLLRQTREANSNDVNKQRMRQQFKDKRGKGEPPPTNLNPW